MKTKLLSAVTLCALGLVGCGDDPVVIDPPVNEKPKVDNRENILAYLEGKTLTMEGDNIPSHPNGYSEDIDYREVSQCYRKVTMDVAAGNFTVSSDLGTIQGSPGYAQPGGTCNHELKSGDLRFVSTAVAIDNVAADGSCFDVTFTFPGGIVQEGRGAFSSDLKQLKLELFFTRQATGHRCANGAVGAAGTVTLNTRPFTGNAVQTYALP